jgi:hypothetical protein
MSGDPHVRFGGREHRSQSMLPALYLLAKRLDCPASPNNGDGDMEDSDIPLKRVPALLLPERTPDPLRKVIE